MRYSKFYRRAQASTLVLALLAPVAAHAQAQEPASAGAQPDEQAGQKSTKKQANVNEGIVVTGSRIKRSRVEGPAPVTVITTDQVRKEGFATIYEALRTTPEALGNVEPDYNWGQTAVNASPLNLRSLGPNRTLLLINGHRVADYPMPYDHGKLTVANFNNLPTGIVQRTEILTGSASAIYGSDAMGGVVNVILNKKADGQTLRLKYGGATRGGSPNWEAVLSGGFHGDNWSIVYNFQHFNRGTLLVGDRLDIATEQAKPRASRNPTENHFGIGKADPQRAIYIRDLTNPGGGSRSHISPPAGACDQFGGAFYQFEWRDYDRDTGVEHHGGDICADSLSTWALRTGNKDNSGYLYGNLDLGNDMTAWASVGVWHTVGGFNAFNNGFFSANYFGAFWDPRAHDGAGAPLRTLRTFAPVDLHKGGYLTESKELATDISAGLKGKLFNDTFDWEAMVGTAHYKIDETFPMVSLKAMLPFFMGPQLGTTADGLPIYEPDYNKLWNPLSPSVTDTFFKRGLKKAKSSLEQAQAVLTGKLFDGWAGPIQMAAVLEAGRQSYHLTPEPRTLEPCNDPATQDCFSTNFGNIEQGGGSRKRYAAGLEFNIPLLKWVDFTAAGRWDKYDAVASNAKFTYQTGLQVRPTQNVLLRGSYGTSFRAPDMTFVYAAPSTGIADFTDYYKCILAGRPNNTCNRGDVGDPFYINDATVSRQGTPDLLYETGKSLTAGWVWDAFRNFSASVDYWKIDIKNLIDDIDANQVLLDEAWCRTGQTPDGKPLASPLSDALCALEISRVHRDASGTVTRIDTGPINRAQTRVSGIDAKASYSIPDTSIGSFNLSASYTVMLNYGSRQFPGDPLRNSVRDQNPRYRFNANVNWTLGKLSAGLFMYQKAGGRNNRWAQCASFPDGFRPPEHPDQGGICKDWDVNSPTYGQSTKILYQHRHPRRYLNGSIGYEFTKNLRANLYVSNIFDHIYRDDYCADIFYCIDDPVGREVSGEIVARF